jgi:hypothetical protein
MRQQQAGERRRDRGLVWGFIAVILLAPAITVWLGHTAAANDGVFGRAGSLATGFTAIAVTVIAAVASYFQELSGGLRWGLGLSLAVIAGAVATLALGTLFSPRHETEFIVDVLLLIAAVSMLVVATEVARRREPRARGVAAQPKDAP